MHIFLYIEETPVPSCRAKRTFAVVVIMVGLVCPSIRECLFVRDSASYKQARQEVWKQFPSFQSLGHAVAERQEGKHSRVSVVQTTKLFSANRY